MTIKSVQIAALTATVLLSGCGTGGVEESPGTPWRPPDLAVLRDQARAALARYDEAVRTASGGRMFVPVGDLTAITDDLEPENYDLKAAIGAGQLVAETELPAIPEQPGTITWVDGASRPVTLISAEDALTAHRHKGADSCDDCSLIPVTGARLIIMQVGTTTGDATVPAWQYTLKGTSVRVTYAAVGDADVVTVTTPPWDPYHAPQGLAIDAVATAKNSQLMTVSFAGSQGPASEPCGEDYHAEAIESDNAVIVIVTTERLHGDGTEICTAIGYPRTENVTIQRPLGDRAVLETQTGTPVTVTVSD